MMRALTLILFTALPIAELLAAVAVESDFVPARLIEQPELRFPTLALRRGQEGWARISYIVGVDGLPDDILIEDSNGVGFFEQAALRWAEGLRFEPATLDGEPVPQAFNRHLLVFDIENFGDGVSRTVRRIYMDGRDALAAGDLDGAAEAIARTEAQQGLNLHEEAWLALLRGLLCRANGDAVCTRDSLSDVLTFGRDTVDAATLQTVAETLLQEELRVGWFQAARGTFGILSSHADAPAPDIVEVMARIDALAASDVPFEVSGELRARGAQREADGIWVFEPLRRRPALVDVDGRLDALEIRCDARQVRIVPEVGRAWRIPESWGQCQLYWFGEPGTRVVLIEYAASAELETTP